MKNKVLNVNCMDFLKDNNGFICNHVITDIPYAIVSRESAGIRVFDKFKADKLEFNLNYFCESLANKTTGNILIFCSSEQVSELNNIFPKFGYKIYLGIWEKTNPSPINGQHFWLSGVECCVIASKDIIKDEDLIWRFHSGRSKNHPTEKPVKLLEFLVEKFSKENELIFDPCAGSGAHLVAAKNKNRSYLGLEVCKQYFDLIKNKGI